MSDPGYASLAFLSYQRPVFIREAVESAIVNAGHPCEVLVHDDGSTDPEVYTTLAGLFREQKVSRLILNQAGQNEGVGTAINRMFKLATGDPILKIDQDLLFEPDWLARVVAILEQDRAIGMLGLFRYDHEPVPWQRMKIDVPTQGGYHYTRQFCGSAFAVPRTYYEQLGPLEEHSDAFAEDMEYMQRVRHADLELALPAYDLITNRGFGIGPSTVVEEGHVVHKIHHGPFVIGEVASTTPRDEPGVRQRQSEPDKGETVEVGDGADPRGSENVPVEPSLPVSPHCVTAAVGRKFGVGVVITTCAGREDNLRRTVDHLMRTRDWKHPHVEPRAVIVVYDDCTPLGFNTPIPVQGVQIPKHGPGQEQPRNVGFRKLRETNPDCNYVWFLDSDLIFQQDILAHFYEGLREAPEERILIGPYDFMAPGVFEFVEERDGPRVAISDYRWGSFDAYGPDHVLVHDLGAGLACFGGNLLWPVDRFEEIGGFNCDLHHGRCEDGELGLRAASAGVPMSFVRDARAWHVWHPVDSARQAAANARDVPLINAIHPWVEQQGLVVTHEDGARFDWRCPECGQQVNSLAYWDHSATHQAVAA